MKGSSFMLDFEKIKIEYCMDQLKRSFRRHYENARREYGNLILSAAQVALESIASSDALYHNVEHTGMVTLSGQAILDGKRLSEGEVPARDWAHFTLALLFHDIGYVKGICRGDVDGFIATGVGDGRERLEFRGTDAVLAPYHVDRSKLVLRERFGEGKVSDGLVDPELVASYVEMTRFPVPDGCRYEDTRGYAGLVRAADFIGQFADPRRLQKCTALFYELEEVGLNEAFGYRTPSDLRENNETFYRDVVSPHIQDALGYLGLTREGKQWIRNLQANVPGGEVAWDQKRETLGSPRPVCQPATGMERLA